MRIRISADGEASTLIFCVKSSILLSHKTEVNTNHMTKKIFHENVDRGSTDSIYGTLYSKTSYRFDASLIQAPNKIIATRPNWTSVYACYAQTHQSQVKEKKGGFDIDVTGSKQSCHELGYPLAANNINEKSHQIKYVPVSSIIFASRWRFFVLANPLAPWSC